MFGPFWKKTGHIIILLGTSVLVYVVGSGPLDSLRIRWYWMMGIMVAFIGLVGWTTNERVDGVLIDWRNKLSLARLQVILWTILGMSSFLTIGMTRIALNNKLAYDFEEESFDPKIAFEHAKAVDDIECLKGITEESITIETLKECPAPDALQIIFPEELLLAMGISVASFAGSALVKRNQSNTLLESVDLEKRLNEEIQSEELRKTTALGKADALNKEIEDLKAQLDDAEKEEDIASLNTLIEAKDDEMKSHQVTVENANSIIDKKKTELESVRKNKEELRNKGILDIRDSPNDAEWSDLFRKEIVNEAHLIDLSKLQMFFFTVTIIFAYGAAVNNLMQQPELIQNPFGVALPQFSSSLVALLGISHGGYLAIKNTDTSATGAKKQ